jgi:putative flippase GtrA
MLDLFILGDLIVKSVPWEYGAVVAYAGNSSITFKTDLASAVNDYCIGSFLKFTSGTLINQVRKISLYNGLSKIVLLTSAYSTTPTATDTFIIINQ